MNTSIRPAAMAVMLVGLLGPFSLSHANPWVDAFGASRPLHCLGFGAMVAGVDASGRIDTLCWPQPGGCDQVAPASNLPALPSGCQWGVARGDAITWLSGPLWKTDNVGPSSPELAALNMVSSSAELTATATQTLVCSPAHGVVAVRIQLDSPDPLPALRWFQRFSPVPGGRNALALPTPPPQASRGFASFFDPQRARVYQFRPANPGSEDWEHARRLQRDQATPAEWSAFQDGAWTATAFSSKEIVCQFIDDEQQAHTEGSVVGQAGAMVGLVPAPGLPSVGAEVFIALGRNRQEVDKQLDTTLQMGFAALQVETEAAYATLLAPAMSLLTGTPDRRARILGDLRALFAALDVNGGTVVGAPAYQPPLAATWPELGAWTALAWQLCGYPDQARRQLMFFHGPLLSREGQASSSAALPELLRVDGTPALPSFVRNPASAAWIVLSAVQILSHGGPRASSVEALAYYTDLVLPVMQYLHRWSSPATGGPPPGFDPLLLRDTNSVANELLYYLAVEGAAQFAALVKREPESFWQSWQRELDALLRFRMVNEPEGWELSPTLAAWAAITLGETNPLRKAFVRTPSGVISLGECAIPALVHNPKLGAPDAFDSAVDVVALLYVRTPKP